MKELEKAYGLGLSAKQLKFLVNCIDIAQESHVIKPDREEMDLIRRIGKKAEQLENDRYDRMGYEVLTKRGEE